MDEFQSPSHPQETDEPVSEGSPSGQAPWWKVALVALVLLFPLWAGVVACCLSTTAAEWIAMTVIDATSSMFRGFVREALWQASVWMGWFALATCCLSGARVALQRASLGWAVLVVVVALGGAAILAGQQKTIEAVLDTYPGYMMD